MKSNEVYSGETQLNSLPQIDLSAILGTWINSNQETEWIRKFTITQEGKQVFINSYAGSSPEDWGKIEVTTYVDNHGQTGFSAQYNLDRVEVLLAPVALVPCRNTLPLLLMRSLSALFVANESV